MINIGHVPSDNVPSLGKVIKFHEYDKFALLRRRARVIRSAEIQKYRRPARHIGPDQNAIRMDSDHALFIFGKVVGLVSL